MAAWFGQRRLERLQDPAVPSQHRDPSPNRSLLYGSATWWDEREEQRDNGDSLREQLKEMDEHVARLQDMLKCERTKCSRLQLRCNQQETELRRREQNSNRMKERLSQFTDRPKDKGPSIRILNSLPSVRGKKEQPSANKREEGAVRLMLERREAELREAMKLRHSLTSLLHALRCDMEQTLSELEGCKDETHYVDKRLDQAEQALGDHVTGGVVQSWRQVQRRLGTFICEGQTEAGTDHDKLMAQLESELKESQQLVELQQQLLQDSIRSPVPSELADSYFLEEWDRLQERSAELDHQRRTFERERQAFTDAAIRLSQERRDLEQQKAFLLKQQYLCESPVFGKECQANNRRESSDLNFSGIRPLNTSRSLIHITPSTTESKIRDVSGIHQEKEGIRTPSTPELYSALNLTYNHRRGTEEDTWDSRTDPVSHTAPPLDWSF